VGGLASGDFNAARGVFAEDSVWDDTRFRPDGAVHHGLGAARSLTEVVFTPGRCRCRSTIDKIIKRH